MENKKRKICLSLLIALAFILPTGVVMAGQPSYDDGTGHSNDAGDERDYEQPDPRSMDVKLLSEAGYPVVEQGPGPCLVSGLVLENPSGEQIGVESGDRIPVEEYYQPYALIVNTGDETDVIEPELEIYRYDAGAEYTIYETSFEDNCLNYRDWIQVDGDCGVVGGFYDCWSWSDVRSSDGDHSFKNTMYDEYKNMQEDYLELETFLDITGQYAVNITWDIFVDGEYDTFYWSYYFPLDYVDFQVYIDGDWYWINNGDGQLFLNTEITSKPGNYYFFDTYLPIFHKNTAQNYLYKAEKIDGKPGWWHVWCELPTAWWSNKEEFKFRFGWHSDKERVNEGAYIDNIKIISIEEEMTKIYQGHSQSWLDWEISDYAFEFPLNWGVEEGEVLIGDYRAVVKVKNNSGGYDDITTIDFTVADDIDCEIVSISIEDSFTGDPVPDGGKLNFGADAHIMFTYHQGGNLPMSDIPIKASGYKLVDEILFEDDFEGGADWVYFYEDSPLYKSDYFAWSGSQSLAFNDPNTHHYNNNAYHLGYSNDDWDMENVEKASIDFYYKAVLADSGDAFRISFTAGGYIITFSTPLLAGPLCQDTWVGPMQPQCSYLYLDLMGYYNALVGYGYFTDDNGHRIYDMGIGFRFTTDSSGVLLESCTTEWSGVYIDDVSVTAEVIGEKVWEDSMVIAGPMEPCETCTAQFEWEDVPYCKYKVCVESLCEDDVNEYNNIKCSTFSVLEDLEMATDPKVASVDLGDCTPEAWCVSNICGYEDELYALATNCDSHCIPSGVNDFVSICPGGEGDCCPCCINVSHLNFAGGSGSVPCFYLEDFSTCPGGWTINDGDSSGVTWACTSTVPSWAYAGGASGTFMLIDDDACGSGVDNYQDELISPVIAIAGYTGIALDFDGDFQDMAGYGEFWVNVSIDGGAYTNVLYETLDVDGFDAYPFLPIDISGIADGHSTIQIKFTYSDNDPGWGSGWAWGALIDNVCLAGSGGGGPTVYFSEDGTTFPTPANWIEVLPGEVTVSGTSNAGGAIPELDFNWLNIASGTYIEAVVGDTSAESDLDLTFRSAIDYYGYPFWCEVLVSPDGGMNVHDVTPWFNPPSSSVPAQIYNLDIDVAIGSDTRVYFQFVGYPSDLDDWWLDDIEVTAPGGGAPPPPTDTMILNMSYQVDIASPAKVVLEVAECNPPGTPTECDGEEGCGCPPGILAWQTVETFNGNTPGEIQYFETDLATFFDANTTHICIRFRLDTTMYEGYPDCWIEGIGFHMHDIRIENLTDVTEITDPEPVFEDFYDDFEDGDMADWCVDCVHYGSEWVTMSNHEWCNHFPAEPIESALVWSTEIEDAYAAWFYGEIDYAIGTGTTVYVELSADGGSNWYIISKIVGAANSGGYIPIPCTENGFDLTPWAGSSILIRVRIKNDVPSSDGVVCVKNMFIAGKQDNTPPATTIQMSGTMTDSGWYSTPVQVTITATDDTGMGEIHYILDGTHTVKSGDAVSFTVSGDGAHDLEFWGVDKMGNEEIPHNSVPTFRIDSGNPPTVAITAPEPGLYLFGNKLLSSSKVFIIGAFTIDATASDVESGVYRVQFYLDGDIISEDTEVPYSSYCAVKHMGAGTIKVVAEDYSGNTAEDTLDITYYKFL